MIKAINPNAVEAVKIDGVEFKIGMLPYGKRVEIESSAFFNRDAKTELEVRAMVGQSHIFVQWGVKGHVGFCFEDGKSVPFKSKKEKFGELEYDIVSEETMNIYAVSGLLPELSEAVTKVNYKRIKTTKN